MVDIDRSIKAYYDKELLSDIQLQQLLALQGEEQQANDALVEGTSGFGNIRLRTAMTFVVGLVLAVMVFFINTSAETGLAQRIAQEIAMNHNKALAVEYQTDSYQALSLEMDKLDFTLRAPQTLPVKALTLMGARYCSIQGQIAAQLKLTDANGRVHTLYQTRLNNEFSNISSNRLQRDQVNIHLWKGQDVLYGFAESPSL